MWTCDVQSKLYDIAIFRRSLGKVLCPPTLLSCVSKLIQEGDSKSETIDTVRARIRRRPAFREKFGCLFNLIDYLEPSRAKFLRLNTLETLEPLFNFYIYTHSNVRWKRMFGYLSPEQDRELAFIEKVYRYLCYSVLYFCDQLHTSSRLDTSAVITGVLVFDEMKHMTKMEKLDPSAVDHVRLALETRLKVLCSQIFNFDERKPKKDIPSCLTMIINRVPELSSCLSPACRNYADTMEKPLRGFLPFDLPDTPLDLPACLLRHSDGSGSYHDERQTESCCCGWAYDSPPSFFLRLRSFRTVFRALHSL